MKAIRDAQTTAGHVLALHYNHPDWCADELAIRLNCGSAYVRKTLSRWNIVVPSKVTRPDAGTPKDRVSPRRDALLLRIHPRGGRR